MNSTKSDTGAIKSAFFEFWPMVYHFGLDYFTRNYSELIDRPERVVAIYLIGFVIGYRHTEGEPKTVFAAWEFVCKQRESQHWFW